MGNWKRWTEKEERFVRDNADKITDAAMADALGRTTGSVQTFRARNDIEKASGAHYNRWTKDEDKVIYGHWPQSPKELIDRMLPGRTMQAITTRAKNLGVDRDPRFSKATQFKPQRIIDRRPEGTVTIRTSDGVDYTYISTDDGSEPYHRFLWEQLHGEIPEGCCLRCKNGDTTNPDPSNWELISIKDHLKEFSDSEAGLKALKAYREKHGLPGKQLSDQWIAGVMAEGDKVKKEYLLTERPDIIAMARAHYKLQRKIDSDGTTDG